MCVTWDQKVNGTAVLEWAEPVAASHRSAGVARQAMNFSMTLYQPWGSHVASATTAVIFTIWISIVNVFLIFLLITNVKLLNSRQNIILLHNAVTDLTAGVFYCPLEADFYIRGFWAHGCGSFFLWSTFFFPMAFLNVHSILMLLGIRIMPMCCSYMGARVSRRVANCLFAGSFVVLWFYLAAVGLQINHSRDGRVHITIAPGVWCNALVANTESLVICCLFFFIPATICLFLMLAIFIRERSSISVPNAQLQLDTDTEQCSPLPVFTLGLITGLTCLVPLPSFIFTSVWASGLCSTLTCQAWLRPLSSVSDWLVLAKSGLIPLVLFLSPDIRSAALGALHQFRRVPTSDRRDLVSNLEDGSDDAPFSTM